LNAAGSIGRRLVSARVAREFSEWVVALALAVAVLTGCSNWRQEGESCVMEDNDGAGRTVNYADPELCDRPVKKRSGDYVRVPAPPPKEER
jgi:uncharacterized lipoprotein